MRYLYFTSLVAFFACLSACNPRGEQASVDKVLENARLEFKSASQTVLDEKVRQRIDRIAGTLEELLQTREVATVRLKANEASDALQSVYVDSGYTSRPALGELVNEYRVIADGTAPQLAPGQIRLLVSRSYGWLASELGGVKFALRGRETRQ